MKEPFPPGSRRLSFTNSDANTVDWLLGRTLSPQSQACADRTPPKLREPTETQTVRPVGNSSQLKDGASC